MPTVTTQSKQPHVISKEDLQNLIAKNLFISVFARIFNLLTRFLIPPLVLGFVSLHEYGLWAISFVIISYFNLGEFGIGNVYIRYVAAYHATHEIEKINGLVSTGIVLVATISFAFLLLSWYVIPLLIEQQIFKISPNHHATAFILFYGTVTLFLISISFNAFVHILNGLQKIAQTSLVMIFCLMIEMGALVIFLFQGFGVFSLLYAFIIRTIVSILIHFFLCHYFISGFSIRLSHFDRSYFKLFYRFGAIVQLQSIFGLILRTIDKLMASTMLSMKATALLDLGSKIPVMSNSISGSMNAVFLPAMSYAYSQQRQQEVFDMYIRGSRTISLFMGFLMGFLTAFAAPLTVAWLGTNEEFQIVAVIMALFTGSRQLHALTGMGTAYFKGIEKPSYTLIYPGARLILVSLIALIVFYWFEITLFNIAAIIVLSTVLGAMYFIIYANHFMKVSQSSYLTQVILPGIVPYGIGYLLLWLSQPWLTVAMTDRWYAAGFILVSGMSYSILTGAIIYWGIFTYHEKNLLRQRIRKILKK
jgi:O-antigen/teichoic acid export membrane protein